MAGTTLEAVRSYVRRDATTSAAIVKSTAAAVMVVEMAVFCDVVVVVVVFEVMVGESFIVGLGDEGVGVKVVVVGDVGEGGSGVEVVVVGVVDVAAEDGWIVGGGGGVTTTGFAGDGHSGGTDFLAVLLFPIRQKSPCVVQPAGHFG